MAKNNRRTGKRDEVATPRRGVSQQLPDQVLYHAFEKWRASLGMRRQTKQEYVTTLILLLESSYYMEYVLREMLMLSKNGIRRNSRQLDVRLYKCKYYLECILDSDVLPKARSLRLQSRAIMRKLEARLEKTNTDVSKARQDSASVIHKYASGRRKRLWRDLDQMIALRNQGSGR
jgi:hypothetical protein